MERQSTWLRWDEEGKNKALQFCDRYKSFLSENKTVRKFLQACVKAAEESGYRPLEDCQQLRCGDKVYQVNRNKQLFLCQVGSHPLISGSRIIAAHIDSPRLDLKTVPLYEEENLAFFKTCYYGGIKKYQWLSIPLSVYGTIVLKNGEKKEVCLGENPGDPVFTITDLLPHLAKDQMKKTIEEGFPGENLNLLVGSIPDSGKDKEPVKNFLLRWLKKHWGIQEEDFISSEFEVVPSGPARDVGFDRSMLAGYGQDDRVCAYTALFALLALSQIPRSAFCILTDQEEIGSYGATSAQSSFFQSFLEELLEKEGGSSREKRLFFQNSRAISADVATALDPNYRDAYDPRNAARLGCGVVLERTIGGRGKTGSVEPTAEYLAYLRHIFDKNQISWQPGEMGKVEQGGGGTISTFFARLNIDTADCGVPVLSMHAPFEVTSKADIYSAFQAYTAFYQEG